VVDDKSEKDVATKLLQLAAELARRQHSPSPFSEDHPPRMPRGYWLRQLEKASEAQADLAIRLRDIADLLNERDTERTSKRKPMRCGQRYPMNTSAVGESPCPKCGWPICEHPVPRSEAT